MKKGKENLLFDENIGKKISKIINEINLPIKELIKNMGVSRGSIEGYKNGSYGLSVYRLYQLVKIFNLSDDEILNFFKADTEKTKREPKCNLVKNENYSINPEINKKINILKQIYESGDETLICGVDLCLKGAYEDFLGRKRKKTG